MDNPGWFKIQHIIVDRAADVGPVAFTVYCVLAHHADVKGVCWPSVAKIAAKVGVTPRAARTALRALETGQFIETTQRRDEDGRNTSSIYKLATLSPREQAEPNASGPGTNRQGEGEPSASIHPERSARGTRNEAPVEQEPIEQESFEQQPVNKKRRAAKAAVAVEIPSSIDTEAFRAAWASWLTYRTSCRKTVPGASQVAQLKKLATWGEATAIKAIENSIANTWQGLFEPKENANDKRIERNAGPGARFKTADYGKPGVF